MERKVGEEFDYKGVTLKVAKYTDCDNCYFSDYCDEHTHDEHRESDIVKIAGECEFLERKLNRDGVVFVKKDDGDKEVKSEVSNMEKKGEKRSIELTLDKAKEWYKMGGDLREVALQAFTIDELNPDYRSHSWEEFCKHMRTGYYVNYYDYQIVESETYRDKYYYPTEKLAKASLALCQLLQIRQQWIGDWREIFNGAESNYVVSLVRDDISVFESFTFRRPLSFPTKLMAEEFLYDFKDLIEIAKPLI